MAFPAERPRRLRRTPALRRLVAETSLEPPAPGAAAVRPGGRSRGPADRVDARRRPAHPRLAAQGCARGGRGRGRRAHALRGAGLEGRDRIRRQRPGRHAQRGDPGRRGRGRRRDCRDGRPVPGRVHHHGHCGVLAADGSVDNDATLRALRRMARGAGRRRRPRRRAERDDGRPGRPRSGRPSTAAGSHDVADPGLRGEVRLGVLRAVPRRRRVVAASATAGPTSRIRPTVARRCARSRLDVAEGADIVMVKPALAYLDVLRAGRATRSTCRSRPTRSPASTRWSRPRPRTAGSTATG